MDQIQVACGRVIGCTSWAAEGRKVADKRHVALKVVHQAKDQGRVLLHHGALRIGYIQRAVLAVAVAIAFGTRKRACAC